MKLLKMLWMMFVITGLALIYIHMQMETFALAYEAKNKEKEIIKIKEVNGLLAYNILELKSSNHLGAKLLAENSNLKFRDPGNVVQLVSAKPVKETKKLQIAQAKRNPNAFLNFLRSQAEAQAAQERSGSPKPWLRFR